MTLGETIKLLRTELELTQPALAEKAGIEQSYLSKLENDKGTPSFDIINRIAQALNLTGMGLIQKLSHSYISDNLSHLPEIAAEYASVKEKKELQMTRRLLAAALMLLVGAALYLVSERELLDSDRQYFYVSEGVLLPGEHPDQLTGGVLFDIGETGPESLERLRANSGRIDRAYQTSDRHQGPEFMIEVSGGRRHFRLMDDHTVPSKINETTQILGLLCMLAGLLVGAWAVWRGKTR